MKWILFVMLFVTPAKNLTSAEKSDHDSTRKLFESHRIWTLQSSSTVELSSQDACVRMADTIRQSIVDAQVATMTLRTWCVCDSPTLTCPSKAAASVQIETARQKTKETEQQRGPAAAQPNTNFTILRMFPPE
jgi:hypothetical protein